MDGPGRCHRSLPINQGRDTSWTGRWGRGETTMPMMTTTMTMMMTMAIYWCHQSVPINQDTDTSWPADGEASGRGKGEKRPHEGLIPPQLDQYHECTGLSNTIGWETRKHIHGTGVYLLQTSEQSVVVSQLMVNVAICSDISISSPRREKCIFSEKKILKVAIPPPPCPGVLARRCSCMCWKDELSDGARTRGTEETGI